MSEEQGQGPEDQQGQEPRPSVDDGGHDDDGTAGSTRGRGRTVAFAAGGLVVAAALVVGGSFLVEDWIAPVTAADRPTPTSGPSPTRSATRPPTPTATPTPTPTGEPTPTSATPEAESESAPQPTITPVAAGTVVAEGDVVSPKCSIRYHYRIVAVGDDSYKTEYSGFTSTLPVPVSVTLMEIAPVVGDGLTAVGPGDLQLGGPTTTPEALTTGLPGTTAPSYLGTLVTYSSTDSLDVPVEIGPRKVLAVDPVTWSVPTRQTNVAPVDAGPRAGATGAVGEVTADGTPRGYLVAADDTVAGVSARFGITTAALIWLNAGLQVVGDEQRLFIDTVLNLDPESR